MEGCLRSARSRKNALDFCKGRMLGKDDAFKVVLDPARDPGADKRGLLRVRPGPLLMERTPEEPAPCCPSGIPPAKALA